MRSAIVVAASVLGGLGSSASAGPAHLVRGVDLSGLENVERQGGRYLEGGNPRDAIELFADRGANFVRLELLWSPGEEDDGIAAIARTAQRARARGLGFLLAIHYSDRRAHVWRQKTPDAWSGVPFDDLKSAVFRYTHDVITELRAEGALPSMVQLGNEITNGLLWNAGRVGGRYDTDAQWTRLAELLRAAKLGLDAALLEGETVRTVIHVDPGPRVGAAWTFCERLRERGVEFDIIGLSFFPWWHGTLDRLGQELAGLAERLDRDILVVATAYPWTLRWVDDTQNEVGGMSELPGRYEPTPYGQRRYLEDLVATVAATPGGRGLGFFYWAGEKISAPGLGSHWENVALFGETGEVLPAARVLGRPIDEGD